MGDSSGSDAVQQNGSAPIWISSPDKVDGNGFKIKQCCLPHCDRPIVAKRLCINHYQAIRRNALDPNTGMLQKELTAMERAARGEKDDPESLLKLPSIYGSIKDYVYIGSGARFVNIHTGTSFSRNEAIAAWGRWVVRAITEEKFKQYPQEVWSPDPGFNVGENFNSYTTPKGLIPEDGYSEPLHDNLIKLFSNLVGGNEKDLNYFLDWLAFKFQNPHVVPCAIILHGAQGSGKGTLTELLSRIFNPCFSKITGGALESDFTGWLYKRLMIVANEVNVSTNKDRHNTRKRLKDYTAPDMIDIHMKYAEHFVVKNHSAWIICSNDKYVVDIESDDRRFSVFHTTTSIPYELGNEISEVRPDYYAKNLFNVLYKRDVSNFRSGRPHENQARLAMKAEYQNSYVRVAPYPPVDN